MTISDLRCDCCQRRLVLPPGFAGEPASQRSIRFSYHPGDPHLRDNSGLSCQPCWDRLVGTWTASAPDRCAACAAPVTRFTSLHVKSSAQSGSHQLCMVHTVAFLNALATVQPKLDQASFRFPGPGPAG